MDGEIEDQSKTETRTGEAQEPDPTETEPKVDHATDIVEPFITTFKDHFTLQIPSSVVKFRGLQSAARVIEGSDAQFVLEESYDSETKKREVSVRFMHDTSEGVRVLRIVYTVVTAFWTGFLLIFSLQILLFLFLDFAIQVGATSVKSDHVLASIGVVLAFPGFVFGLSGALVIAGAFVQDTWRGHYLIRNFMLRNRASSTIEWAFFSFFLGIPLLVMSVALLSGVDEWWSITTLAWFCAIVFFYCVFTANVVFFEMRAAWTVMRNSNFRSAETWFGLITQSILTRQVHQYSGRQVVTYLNKGSIVDSDDTDHTERNKIEETVEVYESWMTKLTRWQKLRDWGLYSNDLSSEEERIYSIEDVRDVRPFMTTFTWTLEKIFCRPSNSRYIAIIRGPGALTRAQMISSLVCSVLGTGLILLVLFSVLVYLGLGVWLSCFCVALAIAAVIAKLQRTFRLYSTTKALTLSDAPREKAHLAEMGSSLIDNRSNPDESECVYQNNEVHRLTKPTSRLCWMLFATEVLFFYLVPFATLFVYGNYPIALLFGLVVGISMLRYYVNAAIVLEEVGNLDFVGGSTEHKRWKNQSRLNEIVGNITRGRSLFVWQTGLASIGFVYLVLMLGAIGTGKDSVEALVKPKNFTEQFEYVRMDTIRYPSCSLLDTAVDGSPLSTMADFTFLAGLAYVTDEIAQQDLSIWFRNESAVNDVDTKLAFDETFSASSAVSYKLFTFPTATGQSHAYLSIRGTVSIWDMLTDAQLWSSTFLMQILRELLPFGNMWTPVMDYLIFLISKLESTSTERISFYKDTTQFVKWLKEKPETFPSVRVTGHSLGGGLALITGAQAKVNAVGVSAPNIMISRLSFNPPLSKEDVNRNTFNIIPERDIVPKADDVAQNSQGIRCLAGFTDLIGCHSPIRSLCEIMYSCGSMGRPALCNCVVDFGYPEPNPKDGVNVTFAEACGMN